MRFDTAKLRSIKIIIQDLESDALLAATLSGLALL